MTETDRQLHVADDDGFIDRRSQVEVQVSSVDQLQLEVAEWEGMGIKTTPNKGEALKASINRTNRKIYRTIIEGEHKEPSAWDLPSQPGILHSGESVNLPK